MLHRLHELHGAHQREFVRDLCLKRHVLADVEAGHVRLDRPELAAIVGRGIRLHVVGFEVRRAAREAHHDDRTRCPWLNGPVPRGGEECRAA